MAALRSIFRSLARLFGGERGGTSPSRPSGTLARVQGTGGNMELDRHYIERKDFTVARRGYEQQEVDLHLRQLADSIAELRAQLKATPAGIAGAAAEQVRAIVEAAEGSAAEIEERATDEARRVTDDASRRAREARERADTESAEQLARVQQTAGKMLARASELEAELDQLVAGVNKGAGRPGEGRASSTSSWPGSTRAPGRSWSGCAPPAGSWRASSTRSGRSCSPSGRR